MIGESDLSELVRAYLFELVNPATGSTVAALTNTIEIGGIPPTTLVGLQMEHGEPAPAGDYWPKGGHLGWTSPNALDAYPRVVLAGALDDDGNRPALTLDNLGGTGAPVTDATLEATAYDGVTNRWASLDAIASAVSGRAVAGMTAGDDTAGHGFATLGVNSAGVFLDAANRGPIVARLQTWIGNGTKAGDTTLGTGFTNSCLQAINCKAGDTLVVTCSADVRCTTLSAGVACVAATCLFDSGGTVLSAGPAAIFVATAAGQRVTISSSQVFTITTDGSYQVGQVVWKSAALGTYVHGAYSMSSAARYSCH